MKGFFNGYKNFEEFALAEGLQRICDVCGEVFIPRYPKQKRHDDLDINNPYCYVLYQMSRKDYIRAHSGLTEDQFRELYGEEVYESL